MYLLSKYLGQGTFLKSRVALDVYVLTFKHLSTMLLLYFIDHPTMS